MSTTDWPIEIDPVFGCHLWTGKLSDDGYGLVWRGRHPIKAHLVVYEAEHGPVPHGLVLDHRCRRRRCVRHLEPVTQSVNLQRRKFKPRPLPCGCDAMQVMITPEAGRICRRHDR